MGNDGDYQQLNEYHTIDKKEALAFQAFCLGPLRRDKNHTSEGMGNTHEYDSDELIVGKLRDFIDSNEYWKNIYKDYDENKDEDILGEFQEVAYDLVGSSEDYKFRVCESATLYEIEEDVYFNKIEIK